MNIPYLPSSAFMTASTDSVLERALAPDILIGMPHLTPSGLSENWLLKELGHRHWLMLARSAGMDNADFRDREGREVYAAISALSMRGVNLRQIRANDVLSISSAIRRLSRTQIWSRHELTIQQRTVGSVELLSTFVGRMREGDNHSITRVALDCLPDIDAGATSRLGTLAAAIRSDSVSNHFGFSLDRSHHLAGKIVEPDETRDFNGAGLLYFSSFPSIADSIIRTKFDPDAMRLADFDRDVFYAGNINIGEHLDVELVEARTVTERCAFHVRIRRRGGAIIARIFARGKRLRHKDLED
jgi:probable biosynthetic protein (TIGR04099 family)